MKTKANFKASLIFGCVIMMGTLTFCKKTDSSGDSPPPAETKYRLTKIDWLSTGWTGGLISYTYVNNKLTQVTSTRTIISSGETYGSTFSFSYDTKGRVQLMTAKDNHYNVTSTYIYTYDVNNKIESVNYSEGGNNQTTTKDYFLTYPGNDIQAIEIYPANPSDTTVYRYNNNNLQSVIENKHDTLYSYKYDNKKNPFNDLFPFPIGNYGGELYNGFLVVSSENNPVSIFSKTWNITSTYEYEYNEQGYPSKIIEFRSGVQKEISILSYETVE
jgi:hypothetical protein